MLSIIAGANYPLNMFPGQDLNVGSGVSIPSHTSSNITFDTSLGYELTLLGSGFTYQSASNAVGFTPTGGTITGLNLTTGGSTVMTSSNFSVSMTQFLSVVSSFDVSGIESLFLNNQGVVVAGRNYGDALDGTQYDDVFTPGRGNDTINGEGGSANEVIFSGAYSDYSFSLIGGSVTVTDKRAGSPDGTDTLTNIQLFQFSDGLHTPSATVNAHALSTGRFGTVAGTSMSLSVTDAFGLTPIQYQFQDNTAASDSGYLLVNGIAQTAGVPVTVTSLDQISYQARSGADTIAVRVYDGYAWGAWMSFTISSPVNGRPVVTALPISGRPTAPGDLFNLSALFSASDPEGDTITKYMVYDAGTAGSVVLVGGQNVAGNPNGAVVAAGDIASVSVAAGNGTDILYVKAFDGLDWGNWTAISVTGANVVTANSAAVSASHLQSYGFSDLFTSNDPNNNQYQFFDSAPATRSVLTNGAVVLNGQQQASNTIVTATSLSSLSFIASGTDTLYARANDGSGWSNWAKVTVTAPADNVPVRLSPGTCIHTPTRRDPWCHGPIRRHRCRPR